MARRNRWVKTTQEALATAIKPAPKGIYWVEQEGEAFYWYTLDPLGEPVKCRGRYTKEYRAEMAAESFGYVRGTKPK